MYWRYVCRALRKKQKIRIYQVKARIGLSARVDRKQVQSVCLVLLHQMCLFPNVYPAFSVSWAFILFCRNKEKKCSVEIKNSFSPIKMEMLTGASVMVFLLLLSLQFGSLYCLFGTQLLCLSLRMGLLFSL